MARFTNYATLSYTGGTTNSNTVTGELVEALSISKVAVSNNYSTNDKVTYVISLINSSASVVSGITLSDDLGAYTYNAQTLYPLEYILGSVRFYINGVLQSAPTVLAGPPLTVGTINVPASSNAILIYEAAVTSYAPLGTEASITNTATVSGSGITSISATETINLENRPQLTVSKAVSPSSVTENGQLTYTLVIHNSGGLAASDTEQAILTDTFDPILSSLSVTFDGTAWTQGVNYTYDSTTGLFSTIAGQIQVPAATYEQNSDGTWTITPGTATLIVTGTV